MKERLFQYIDLIRDEICDMADFIFDHPEEGLKEYQAVELLTGFLSLHNFSIEKAVGGLETSFRAVYENGVGGPSIGLLCEYDALKGVGHACAHHMQGPAIVAVASALKDIMIDYPFKLVVYGTPAEEVTGGKIIMLENGCFKDIDVALMMHGAPTTTTDIKCMSMSTFEVAFFGKSAHAAIKAEDGRSALDALLLSFNGIEFLREHVKEDTRMHYTVTNGGGPDNVVPNKAAGTFTLRSYNRKYLDSVVERFKDIIKGASLMTGTTFEISENHAYSSKIPVLKLNDILMENARLIDAPTIRPAREKTGSTDLGNVMYTVPGSCIRLAFVPENTSPHSQEYLDAGKSDEAHRAVLCSAKILAASCCDMISDENIILEIQREFKHKKDEMDNYF